MAGIYIHYLVFTSALLTAIHICSAMILCAYKAYSNQRSYYILNAFAIILDFVVCIAFPIKLLQWYTYLFSIAKSVAMSTNQYMCNIYVTAYFLTCFGIATILYESSNYYVPIHLHYYFLIRKMITFGASNRLKNILVDLNRSKFFKYSQT